MSLPPFTPPRGVSPVTDANALFKSGLLPAGGTPASAGEPNGCCVRGGAATDTPKKPDGACAHKSANTQGVQSVGAPPADQGTSCCCKSKHSAA